MSSTTGIVSLFEYQSFEAPEGTSDELIEGEVVISPSGTPRHALVIKRIMRLLDDLVGDSEFEVNSELSIILDCANPASMPRPDVFVMGRERFLDAAKRDVFPVGSPELAIEVASPGNTEKDLTRKVALYLRYGSHAVWVVYPKQRVVAVWETETAVKEYGEDQVISLPHPLPPGQIAVRDIFSALP